MTNIDLIADLPLFLTPVALPPKLLPNWNMGTILNKIDFDFDAYKDKENFLDENLDYALQMSKETDQFGFVLHSVKRIKQLSFITG